MNIFNESCSIILHKDTVAAYRNVNKKHAFEGFRAQDRPIKRQ
jgi:hypothetical protein